MFKNLTQIFHFFDKKTKTKIIIFQLFIIFSSFLEVISFGSLIPFFTIITDPEVIDKNLYLNSLKQYLNVKNNLDFIKILGLTAIFLVIFSNAILLFSIFIIAFFGQRIGMNLSHRIFTSYLYKSYIFFTNNDSSFLSARITSESIRIAEGVIVASLIIFSRTVFVLFIIFALLIIDFVTSSIVVLLFSLAYVGYYLSIKKFISQIGKNTSKANEKWYRYIQESFNAIKELIILNRLKYYDNSVRDLGGKLASYKAWNIALGQSPRYFIEVVAFVFLLLYLIFTINSQNTFLSIVPILTLYGIAGYKLLPTFQAIYYNYNHLRYHIQAFENLKEDIVNIKYSEEENTFKSKNKIKLDFKNKIQFVDVSYNINLKEQSKKILSGVNLEFYKNSLNAIIGQSGSGKTTIIDVLLGLRIPTFGKVLIDEIPLNYSNHLLWRHKIGYVPQKIFIINGNILENICIGLDKKSFNEDRAIECLLQAGLEEFADKSKDGIYRSIGEKGLKISGGQIQRIGIARSLYNNPEVLVFDEATSSLDAIAERKFYKILETLVLDKKTVILISHKVDYLKKFKIIHLMKNGKLFKSGSYLEMENYNEFQELLINKNFKYD